LEIRLGAVVPSDGMNIIGVGEFVVQFSPVEVLNCPEDHVNPDCAVTTPPDVTEAVKPFWYESY
jgi:hypothetical protein